MMVDWLFFHNTHDIVSLDALHQTQDTIAAMPEGSRPNFVVYDVFSSYEPPVGIRLTRLPYLVNKQFGHNSQVQYLQGGILIQFTCQDWQGTLIPDEAPLVFVSLDGGQYSLQIQGGAFTIKLVCNEPRKIAIHLEADGYMPLDMELEVV